MQKNIFDLFFKIKYRISLWLFKQKFKVTQHDSKIVTLGSKYGGWSFVDNGNLVNSTIISCGLGEDASFDIEFANLFDATIIFVDPTPRAVAHFNDIRRNLGSIKSEDYKNSGAENVSSYNLQFLTESQIQLVDKAIWINDSSVKFYLPKDKSHVSHSIVNFQNDYSTDTEHIQVNATTIKHLIEKFKLPNLQILKLDIEGAEIQVVQDLLNKNIFPRQLLLEYDELQKLNRKVKSKIYRCHLALLGASYELIKVDNINFLYIHNNN